MRLIDADELMTFVFKNPISYKAFCNLVKHQMPVDAVPVVRCKDCKHKIINENHPDKPLICCRTLTVGETKPEWYCADGER